MSVSYGKTSLTKPVSCIYRDVGLSPTIQRTRPWGPLLWLDYRRGAGDRACMLEVTGGFGGDFNPQATSMLDRCQHLLDKDPQDTMGDFLTCVNQEMARGVQACGYGYGNREMSEECSPDCAFQTGTCESRHNLVERAMAASGERFPSPQAEKAAIDRWRNMGKSECGCWDRFPYQQGK
jgi:hypothetical protein